MLLWEGGICSAMNDEYISNLVDKYGNMILRLSYTYMKSQADSEDVVQEVFLKIINKEPVFNDSEHEKAWIIRSTINICKNKLKSFWKKNVGSIDDIKDIPAFDNYTENSDVLKAVMSLPEKYRIIIHLYYYEEYTTPEIAGLMGKNTVTIRSLLHRAREKLKIILKEEYDFE